jgi:predicted lipoprotein
MRICTVPFLSLAIALSACPAVAQEGAALSPRVLNEKALPAVMEKAVDDFIRPGYRHLVEVTQSLSKATHSFCENPSKDGLGEVQGAFDGVVHQWSDIEIIRVGPVIEGNRFERFLFYPDRKSTGLKQVQAILAKQDETATSADTIKGKSVAVQGLGALEYVLYGTGSEALAAEKKGFRCRYGAAIADNLVEVASELSAEWEKPDGIQAAWKRPGANNPVFRTANEAATGLLGILVHGIETVKDQRLRPFYAGIVNGKIDPGHPKLAIYWRSGNTMPSISTNLKAMQTLFSVSDMESLLPEDSRSVAGSVNFVFKSIIGAADKIDLPIDEALADDEERGKLDFIALNTQDLLDRVNRDFGGAIGLGAGFSFADGD